MIKRKDGRWQEQIKLPGMDKPKYFYGRTQREVQRKLAAWSMEREQEQAQATQISVVVEQWAERHQEEISASSWQSYPAAVRDVLQWFQGREIGDVYPDEITDFLQAIAARGYSRRTVQRRRDVLTLVWDYAIERRLTRYNAARQARMPRGLPETSREPPTPEQLERIGAGFRLPFGLFAAIEGYTGMRRGEILALRWEDVNRDAGIIYVRRAVAFVGNSPHLKPPKTKRGLREVIIPAPLGALLPDRRHGLVFPGPDGGLLRLDQFRAAWRGWCRSVGLGVTRYGTEVTTHQLRHFYASVLYDAGIGVKEMQTLLGHANMQTTMNIYTHIMQSRKQATADRLDRYLCQNPVSGEKDQ